MPLGRRRLIAQSNRSFANLRLELVFGQPEFEKRPMMRPHAPILLLMGGL